MTHPLQFAAPETWEVLRDTASDIYLSITTIEFSNSFSNIFSNTSRPQRGLGLIPLHQFFEIYSCTKEGALETIGCPWNQNQDDERVQGKQIGELFGHYTKLLVAHTNLQNADT